jgi:hypothetical protein
LYSKNNNNNNNPNRSMKCKCDPKRRIFFLIKERKKTLNQKLNEKLTITKAKYERVENPKS